MDWSQYLSMAFVILAPAYFLYRMHKQDKEFAEYEKKLESK